MFKKLLTSKFKQRLDDAYYAKYPEEWRPDDSYLIHPVFASILHGDTDRFSRPRQDGEKVTSDSVIRAGRKIWEVSRVYEVRIDVESGIESQTTQNSEGVLTDTYTFKSSGGVIVGYLKLVEIKVDDSWFGDKQDVLVFEKVEQ